jgi:uncharacterized protein
MIMVPFISALLTTQGFPANHIVKVAIATSLATILFTSVSSVWAHHKKGAVRWSIVYSLAPGIVLGALIAAQIAGTLKNQWMEIFFGLFVGYMAMQMLKPKTKTIDKSMKSDQGIAAPTLPANSTLFGVGSLIGALSAMVGAGGGFMTVPYLTGKGIPLPKAVAISAACGFPIALAGAVGYIIAGWDLHIAPYTTGYIYWPALLVISAASVVTAPWGAHQAATLPVAMLRKFFGAMLLCIAAYMLWLGLKA